MKRVYRRSLRRGRSPLLNFFFAIIFLVLGLPLLFTRGCQTPLRTGEGKGDIPIKVFLHNKGTVQEMGFEEYLKGVVAAEMPASFAQEALKAQALAARTYAYRRVKRFGGPGTAAHPEADISTDPNVDQAWLSKEELKKRWGFWGYYRYWKKISQAVEDTKGEIITYQGAPIDALFFSTSGGKTENSEDYFQNVVPYLRSVVSPYEERSPRLTGSAQFTYNEFIQRLGLGAAELNYLRQKGANALVITEKSEGGSVKRLKICGKEFSGREVREKLGLNSANFTWGVGGGKINFSTIGYGHGVGMSQWGANGYAEHGWDYRQIITHYYTGVEIQKIAE